MEVYCMCEENTSQKERFLQEVEQKLLHRELDARLLEDGLIHVRWNKQPLCSVDRDGIVRFRPADITGSEIDRKLRTVTQVAAQVKEYMQIFDRAPALKAVGLDDTYKVLADFGDAVLAGQLGKKGAMTQRTTSIVRFIRLFSLWKNGTVISWVWQNAAWRAN